MGRGRQKAKQTKVARQLKYFSPETDYDALQRELASDGSGTRSPAASDDADEEDESSADDEDDYAEWSPGRRR